MDIRNRIQRSLANRADAVFLRREFNRFGSRAAVNAALKRLVTQRALMRIGQGLYVKTAIGLLTGELIPAESLDLAAYQALKKLGIPARMGEAWRVYNAGLTTQIPAGIVFDTGKRRIARKIGFRGKFVRFENPVTPAIKVFVDTKQTSRQ
ncbi:MAG: DUF6088 family protein [Acidiferrobacter sp.]